MRVVYEAVKRSVIQIAVSSPSTLVQSDIGWNVPFAKLKLELWLVTWFYSSGVQKRLKFYRIAVNNSITA